MKSYGGTKIGGKRLWAFVWYNLTDRSMFTVGAELHYVRKTRTTPAHIGLHMFLLVAYVEVRLVLETKRK